MLQTSLSQILLAPGSTFLNEIPKHFTSGQLMWVSRTIVCIKKIVHPSSSICSALETKPQNQKSYFLKILIVVFQTPTAHLQDLSQHINVPQHTSWKSLPYYDEGEACKLTQALFVPVFTCFHPPFLSLLMKALWKEIRSEEGLRKVQIPFMGRAGRQTAQLTLKHLKWLS